MCHECSGGDVYERNETLAATAAPEPATWALLGAGLVVVGGVARRRRTEPA